MWRRFFDVVEIHRSASVEKTLAVGATQRVGPVAVTATQSEAEHGVTKSEAKHRKRKENGVWRKMSKKARKEVNKMKDEGGAIGGATNLSGDTAAPAPPVLALQAPELVRRKARKPAWRRRVQKAGIPLSKVHQAVEEKKKLTGDVMERWEAVLMEAAEARGKIEEREAGAAEAIGRISAALKVVRRKRTSFSHGLGELGKRQSTGEIRMRKRAIGSGDDGSADGGKSVVKKRKSNRQRMLEMIRSKPDRFANPEGCEIRKYLLEKVDEWWLTDERRPARLAALKGERKERIAARREAEERRRVAWERMEDQRVRVGQYTGVPAGGGPGKGVLGKVVEKKFGRRFYKGVVKTYVPDEHWYLVRVAKYLCFCTSYRCDLLFFFCKKVELD
jgi:hypothetical protein